MSGLCSTMRVWVWALSFLAILAGPVAADIYTYELIATPSVYALPPGSPVPAYWPSGFTLLWTDFNQDGLFQPSELVAGSASAIIYNGSTYAITGLPTPGDGTDDQQTFILGTNFDFRERYDAMGNDLGTRGPVGIWKTDVGTGFWSDDWLYSNVQWTAAPVPLTPSVFLLASGLIPLAWARRKKLLRK
jgi:hypothetical protein